MILFFCFIFPPLAVLMMGRPFSAFLNMIYLCFFWVPAIKHSLTLYADYKVDKSVGKITTAINNPHHVQAQTKATNARAPRSQHVWVPPSIDNPHVGANGTVFKRK